MSSRRASLMSSAKDGYSVKPCLSMRGSGRTRAPTQSRVALRSDMKSEITPKNQRVSEKQKKERMICTREQERQIIERETERKRDRETEREREDEDILAKNVERQSQTINHDLQVILHEREGSVCVRERECM